MRAMRAIRAMRAMRAMRAIEQGSEVITQHVSGGALVDGDASLGEGRERAFRFLHVQDVRVRVDLVEPVRVALQESLEPKLSVVELTQIVSGVCELALHVRRVWEERQQLLVPVQSGAVMCN